jgi:hypothetical protein
MKTIIKTISNAILFFICIASTVISAQDRPALSKTTLSIETDPSTFLFNGYAFHIRVKPKTSEHFVIGAGTYALDLPDVMVDINSENKSKGWNVRINSAYSLFGEYYFKEANNRWFAGLQTGIQNYKNTNDHISKGESSYSTLLLMPSIGYNWHPFKSQFYIKPWFGLGYTSKVSGDNSINNVEYIISPIMPFATLHVGYTLNKGITN